MKEQEIIHNRLASIATALEQNEANIAIPDLMGGQAGLALFYAYYYQLTGGEKWLEALGNAITRSLESLDGNVPGMSFCSGLSGIAWCLQHLVGMGLADEADFGSLLIDCDRVLDRFLEEELEAKNYDFLHQGLGVLLYFIERMPHPAAQASLEKAVHLLARAATPMPVGISWQDHFTPATEEQTETAFYNLGLAHGVPAILNLLGSIYDLGIRQDTVAPLLLEGTRWLLSERNPASRGLISLFPILTTRDKRSLSEHPSRVGWCYGDLCIAHTALQTGIRLQQEDIKQAGLDIYHYTIQNRDKENGSIADAGLCHGSGGLAHMYYNAYRQTGDTILLQGATQWLDETLAMNTWEDGIAGYKRHTHVGDDNSYGLLDGVAGIGLGLIAAMGAPGSSDWNRCLLLS